MNYCGNIYRYAVATGPAEPPRTRCSTILIPLWERDMIAHASYCAEHVADVLDQASTD
jgi:hypothetical protein